MSLFAYLQIYAAAAQNVWPPSQCCPQTLDVAPLAAAFERLKFPPSVVSLAIDASPLTLLSHVGYVVKPSPSLVQTFRDESWAAVLGCSVELLLAAMPSEVAISICPPVLQALRETVAGERKRKPLLSRGSSLSPLETPSKQFKATHTDDPGSHGAPAHTSPPRHTSTLQASSPCPVRIPQESSVQSAALLAEPIKPTVFPTVEPLGSSVGAMLAQLRNESLAFEALLQDQVTVPQVCTLIVVCTITKAGSVGH